MKALPSSRPSTSTSTSSSNAPLAHSHTKKRPQTAAEQLEAELERSLLGEDDDAAGDPDDDFADLLPPERQKKSTPPKMDIPPMKNEKKLSFKKLRPVPSTQKDARKEEEEESEGEIKRVTEAPLITTAPPKAQAKLKGRSIAAAAAALRANVATSSAASTSPTQALPPPVPPTHPLPPKPIALSLAPTPESSRKPVKVSLSKKRELPQDLPTQSAVKKAKQSPPAKAALARPPPTKKELLKKELPKKKEPVTLAFPGGEDVMLPLDTLELPGPSRPDPTALALPGDDSENEDWDPVPQIASTSRKPKSPEPPMRSIEMIEIIPEPTPHEPPGVSAHLTMEEVEEDDDEDEFEAVDIDENELQRELDAHFGQDEEEEGDTYQTEQPEQPQFTGVPISLNTLAGQFGDVDDDDSDDDTTSDESD